MILVLVVMVSCVGATDYYIDYESGLDTNDGLSTSTPWQRHPEMVGFTGSYTHQAGDKFFFKGGVTWDSTCFPMKYRYGGSGVGNEDVLTANKTWYSGASFSKPVFDGGSNMDTADGVIDIDGMSYVNVSGLKIVNVAQPGQKYNGRAIRGNGILEGIIIEDCELIPYSSHAIVLNMPGGVEITEGVKIRNNKISHAANSIEIALDNCNANYSNMEISGNEIFDPHTQLVENDHGDGIHAWNNDDGKCFKDMEIFNNKFYGNWSGSDSITSNTAQIYLEQCCNGCKIYNNRHSFSNDFALRDHYLISPGFITASGDNIEIYSNSMSASKMSDQTGTYGVAAGIRIGGDNFTIKGNVIKGARFGISYTSVSNLTSDYNVVDPRPGDGHFIAAGDGQFRTLSEWQGQSGQDTNSLETDPLFTDIINTPLDLSLQSNSPCRDALPTSETTSFGFSEDILGVTRPQGSEWDIGAYEYTPPCTPHDADTSGDCTISQSELNTYISSWKSNPSISLVDIIDAIGKWKDGGY